MFKRARIKLTLWYLLIIMGISVSFSVVIYSVLMREVERFSQFQRMRIERQFHIENSIPPELTPLEKSTKITDPDLVGEMKTRLLFFLVIINGGIFLFSGYFGYILAGRTLCPIQEMVGEQNQFISDASHELRTPLTSMRSATEVNLRNKSLTLAESIRVLKDNLYEIERLERLSNELLELAQYQKPNGTMQTEKLRISTVIDVAIKNVQEIAKTKKIVIQKDIHDIFIQTNRYGLINLLTILLENALKYSGKSKHVRVVVSQKDEECIISVIDKGIGISKKDVDHIFDRFYRADSARSEQSITGYGLGLSIAKKIVETYHGSMTVESVLGKGSCFTVRIPVSVKPQFPGFSFFS